METAGYERAAGFVEWICGCSVYDGFASMLLVLNLGYPNVCVVASCLYLGLNTAILVLVDAERCLVLGKLSQRDRNDSDECDCRLQTLVVRLLRLYIPLLVTMDAGCSIENHYRLAPPRT